LTLLFARLRRVPLPVWLMAAVLLAGGASALFKGSLPDVTSAARARVAAWSEPPRPETAIWAAVDAAKAGDVARYLALFAQPMRGQLEESRKEMGEAAFRDYLVKTASQPKGIALSSLDDPQAPPGATARYRVEFVFADRNEVQQYTVQNAGRQWQIARVDSAERIKTLIPYGTPVEKVFGPR
jgi:hypothetical protein